MTGWAYKIGVLTNHDTSQFKNVFFFAGKLAQNIHLHYWGGAGWLKRNTKPYRAPVYIYIYSEFRTLKEGEGWWREEAPISVSRNSSSKGMRDAFLKVSPHFGVFKISKIPMLVHFPTSHTWPHQLPSTHPFWYQTHHQKAYWYELNLAILSSYFICSLWWWG